MSIFKMKTTHWHIARVIHLLAGGITFLSLTVVIFTGQIWFSVIAFLVALMQIIYALTGYCLSAIIMDKLGVKRD